MTSSRALVCPWAMTEPSKDHKDCGTVPLPTLVTLPSGTCLYPSPPFMPATMAGQWQPGPSLKVLLKVLLPGWWRHRGVLSILALSVKP